MKHNFNEVIDRRVSECKKYEPSYPKDVIPMWIADTDFAVPEEIKTAIGKRAEHPCYEYPVESFEFEKAAARWEKVRFGWDVDPEWVKYSNGVLPFLMYAIRAFAYPGDKVVIQPPVYPPFQAVTKNNGCQLLTNPLIQDENGKYQIDFEDLEEKLKDPRTKLFFMSNPHNPVMRAFTLEELTRIGELCLKYNVIVIADEIHCDLTYKGYHHIPFASVSEEFAQNCMVLINPSKTFNIAGFRTGAAIIPNKKMRDNIQIIIEDNKNYGRTIFGMLSFITAYTECDYYADEMMEYLEENKNYIVDFIRNRIPKIRLAVPEATYLLWLDCRGMQMTQPELKTFAVAGIIVGILSLTGLGLKFSMVLLALSGGHKLVLMVFTMAAGLILGMGMTTTSVYIVLSVLVAPALVEFGVYPIAAHLFVFYFGILSCITPPVATAVFAAAGLVEESPVKLGFYTARRAIPIYMIPFLFVLNPELLMLGNHPWLIVFEFLMSVLTIIALCGSIEGVGKGKFSMMERVLLFAAAVCELHSSIIIKIVSNTVIAVILLKNYLQNSRYVCKF